MAYEKPRVITITPKAIAIGLLSGAVLLGGYFYLRGGTKKTTPLSYYRQLSPEQQKQTLYGILNEQSAGDLLKAIPEEKRKALMQQSIRELPASEKIKIVGQSAKESIADLLSSADEYSGRILSRHVDYGAFTPKMRAPEAANEILTILGGK